MTRTEIENKIVDSLDDWDIDLLLEFAKAEMKANLFTATDEELLDEYEFTFGERPVLDKIEEDTDEIVQLNDTFDELVYPE